jgi:hypothetical protein
MRRQLTIIASILAGCLIIGLLFSRITVSQVAPNVPPQPTVGRFQVALSTDTSGGISWTILLCDTTTGQCWMQGGGMRGGSKTWRDLGSPFAAQRPDAEKIDAAPKGCY